WINERRRFGVRSVHRNPRLAVASQQIDLPGRHINDADTPIFEIGDVKLVSLGAEADAKDAGEVSLESGATVAPVRLFAGSGQRDDVRIAVAVEIDAKGLLQQGLRGGDILARRAAACEQDQLVRSARAREKERYDSDEGRNRGSHTGDPFKVVG